MFPITHVGGLVWMFNTMQTGAELLLVEVFSPEDAPEFLAEHGVTCAGAGTVFWQAYLAAQRKQPDVPLFPDVRIFNGGGAPKPPHIHDEMMAEMGAPVIGGWGLTESPINTMVDVDDPRRQEGRRPRAGRARRRAARRHRRRRARRPGRGGRAAVRGPQVCLGYLDASLDADGFTDDRRRQAAGSAPATSASSTTTGYVSITGRLKDIIIRKGENISAKEIEDLLYAHPTVADVAVVGVPDRRERRAGVRGGRGRAGRDVHVPRDDRVPHERRPHPPEDPRAARDRRRAAAQPERQGAQARPAPAALYLTRLTAMSRLPVIIGVGQSVHRDEGAEARALVLDAARAAGDDSASNALQAVNAIEMMRVGSWRDDDVPGAVAEALGLVGAASSGCARGPRVVRARCARSTRWRPGSRRGRPASP